MQLPYPTDLCVRRCSLAKSKFCTIRCCGGEVDGDSQTSEMSPKLTVIVVDVIKLFLKAQINV